MKRNERARKKVLHGQSCRTRGIALKCSNTVQRPREGDPLPVESSRYKAEHRLFRPPGGFERACTFAHPSSRRELRERASERHPASEGAA